MIKNMKSIKFHSFYPLGKRVLKLVEEVTPQILFLDTKPFVISTDDLFQVDAYF